MTSLFGSALRSEKKAFLPKKKGPTQYKDRTHEIKRVWNGDLCENKNERTRCAQDKQHQFLCRKKTNIYSYKKKLKSTAKIKSTSKISSSKLRQISSKVFQVTDKRSKNRKHLTFYKLKKKRNHWQRIKLMWQQQHWKKKNRFTAPF